MSQEKLVKLLCELIKNSRRSDRDLAKILGFSQPSVSRLRKTLEKEAILQYTAIPDFSYLGFDLIVFTFYRMKEPLHPLREKAEKWLKEQPNVVFSSEGQGMEADRVMLSVHRDYADFSEFHQKCRRELGAYIESFRTFIVSLRGHETWRLFTFNDLVASAVPIFSAIDSQKRRWNRSLPSNLLKRGPVLDVKERDSIIATYTSAADKMKVFSAFIREGLENGDAVFYVYPDEESETVRTKLEEYGVDVEEYERDDALFLESLGEFFTLNGKLDFEKAVIHGLSFWSEAKSRKYNHARVLQDLGDFSFVNGQWQKYIIDYWHDPRWEDSEVSEWIESKGSAGVVYKPFIMEIAAINVSDMTEEQINEILKSLREIGSMQTKFIDLLEQATIFAGSIGLDHEQLVGRKILLEFDPTSEYEIIVVDFAKESMANVEPVYVFTYATSTLYKRLAKLQVIKLFSMSTSTSTLQSISENEVLIPANNTDLILNSIDEVVKTHSKANISIVFDGLSDFLSSLGPERTFTFLRHVLQTLSSGKTTSLFLLNSSAHDPKIVSRLRSLFYDQLAYRKAGLQTVKLSKIE
jgi:DNA-binding Lrp family transcriptional regulator/KaiC/GvpD/RAD55 family RecA-like ATPase